MTCCWHTKIHILVTFIVIVGAINWGAHAFCYNFVDNLSRSLNNLLETRICYNRYIYLLVANFGVALALNKNLWFPYLSKTVLPSYTVLLHTPPNSNKKILINVKPNSKVIYWTGMYDKWDSEISLKLKEKHNEHHCGVVMSDEFGNAELLFEDNNNLDKSLKHIHYRVLGYHHHMMSEVKKIYY